MWQKHRGLIIGGLVLLFVVANIFSPWKIGHVKIELAPEPLFRLGPLVVTNTILGTWMAMLLLVVGGLVLRRRTLVDIPKAASLQNVVETLFEALYNFMHNIAGAQTASFFPVVATFFLFILANNWLGMLPGFGSLGLWRSGEGEPVFVPLLRGPTTDLNTTIALAICSVLAAQAYGIHAQGFLGYASRFVPLGKIIAFFRELFAEKRLRIKLLLGGFLDIFIGILELFEEMTKVLSFAFRLFGNMFGGEVLLAVMAFLAPYVVSLPFLALEIFGGFIQAFIFATLTTAFLSRATSSHQRKTHKGSESPAVGSL